MYRHLLIATDDSELSHAAIHQGMTLAAALSARVTAMTVTEVESTADRRRSPVATTTDAGDGNDGAAIDARFILTVAADAAAKAGVQCETVHVRSNSPAESIVDTAHARGCDLIVLGSRGRTGLARIVLGSQADRVLSLSPVSTLVCR
jgi:nucleotide-binding universal stress UspA family protein